MSECYLFILGQDNPFHLNLPAVFSLPLLEALHRIEASLIFLQLLIITKEDVANFLIDHLYFIQMIGAKEGGRRCLGGENMFDGFSFPQIGYPYPQMTNDLLKCWKKLFFGNYRKIESGGTGGQGVDEQLTKHQVSSMLCTLK